MNKKYLVDGSCVNLIQKLENSKYLVENIYHENRQSEPWDNDCDYEYDDYYCDTNHPYIVNDVFDNPPTAKFHKEIQGLTSAIEKLNKTHIEMKNKICEMEEEHNKRLEKLKKYEALKHIEDFIDGKITHYAVLESYRPEIIKLEDTASEYSRDNFKLLTLFGNTKGDLQWKLNKYSDGSGSNDNVIPCKSEEEARGFMKEYLYKYCIETKRYGNDWAPRIDTVKKAQSFGAEFSDEFIAKIKNKKLDKLKEIESKKEKEYIEAKNERLNFKGL